MRVDHEDDRVEDEYKGRKIKALYTNGWFTGSIRYLNKKLDEYNVLFDDGTEDYIQLADVDGVEIQLL